MLYYKPNGQPAFDSGIDDSGAAGASPQQGFGSPSPAAPSSDAGLGGSSTVPGSLTFVSDDGGPPPTSTSTATTTQTVTFANSGLVFNNTYTGNVSAAYQSCVLSAEQALANICTNSVTINVEFDAEAQGQNGELASNEFWTVNESYASLKSALTSLSSTEPNNTVLQQAVAHLPSTDPSGGQGFELPLAYAQILGLSTETRSPEDIVTLNTSYNWSFGQDVINTLEHEISEGGMGRIGGLGDQNSFWSTMDLFRYNSSGQPDYTDGRDGRTTYFSYNGGATLSALSFNNEFSGSAKINGGDTADFTQLDVFGTGSPGETNTLSATDIRNMEALGWAPSGGTAPSSTATAVLVMDQASTGDYEIYDIGNNAVLSASPLTQVGSPWQPITIGGFNGTDTSDLLLRNGATGAFELYDVIGNNASGPVTLGTTSLSWAVQGFGDFSSNPGETDMLMRNSTALEVSDISNNQITSTTPMGAVGPEWQFLGVGDFSSNANETDMLMRDVNNGALEVYDISHNAVVSATGMGAVGLEWQFVGVGDFSSNPGETDMLMRDVNNGALEVYNIHNDQVVSASAMGAIGMEWSLVGVGDFSGNPGETDMLMRDANNGAFEVYDVSHDSVVSASSIGAVGTDWLSVGVAPFRSSSTAAASSASSATDDPQGGEILPGGVGATVPSLSDFALPAGTAVAAQGSGATQSFPGFEDIISPVNDLSTPSAPAGQISYSLPPDVGNPGPMGAPYTTLHA